MESRFWVKLNGTYLSSVCYESVIADISYPVPEISRTVANFAGRDGGIVTGKRKESAKCVITFAIHEYSTTLRQDAYMDIVKWCKDGGVLETSDRYGQYLYCECTKLPSIESASKWTDRLTMEFTAYTFPYWRSSDQTTKALTGTEETDTMKVDGSAQTYADVEVLANAAITGLTVGFGDTEITLAGIEIAANEKVVFSHTEDGILSIKKGTTSLMDKRTAASSDDLVAQCGTIAVSVAADASVTATFKAKEVWD